MNEIREFAHLRPADEVFDPATNERIWAKIHEITPLSLDESESVPLKPGNSSMIELVDVGSGKPPVERPKHRLALLGTAAALLIGVAGLVIFRPPTSTEPAVATQPGTASLPPVSEVSSATRPLDGATLGSSVPGNAPDELFPPKLTLDLNGWEVAAGDLGDRSVRYQFEHVDGRQLDITVEAGGVDVYHDRIATLSPDAVEVIDDISQVTDLATIGGYRLDALLEPGSVWVLQAVGAGFADRADFVATITALENSPRSDG